MTILELAQEVGVPIPTLCHDPCLRPVGACRVCLVEDESSQRFLASCVTPIASGMRIQTRSPRVLETRRGVFEKGLPHLGTVGRRVATTCSFCGCGCSLWVHAREDRLVQVTPRWNDS